MQGRKTIKHHEALSRPSRMRTNYREPLARFFWAVTGANGEIGGRRRPCEAQVSGSNRKSSSKNKIRHEVEDLKARWPEGLTQAADDRSVGNGLYAPGT